MLAAILLLGCINSSDLQPTGKEKFAVSIKVISNSQIIVDQNISVQKGKTALQALQETALVETKEYSFGKFITGISGINSTSSEYWSFYINGEYAQVGADSYVIESPVELTFKLESLSNFPAE
ncbi:MAG: DUF4430 domain-containing protein [archaeon]